MVRSRELFQDCEFESADMPDPFQAMSRSRTLFPRNVACGVAFCQLRRSWVLNVPGLQRFPPFSLSRPFSMRPGPSIRTKASRASDILFEIVASHFPPARSRYTSVFLAQRGSESPAVAGAPSERFLQTSHCVAQFAADTLHAPTTRLDRLVLRFCLVRLTTVPTRGTDHTLNQRYQST